MHTQLRAVQLLSVYSKRVIKCFYFAKSYEGCVTVFEEAHNPFSFLSHEVYNRKIKLVEISFIHLASWVAKQVDGHHRRSVGGGGPGGARPPKILTAVLLGGPPPPPKKKFFYQIYNNLEVYLKKIRKSSQISS